MKKIRTLPTGIVLLITILFAGGCSSAQDPERLEKVTIYLKAHKIGEEMHLKMYDSADTNIVVTDTLVTDVKPGTKVIWTFDDNSGIEGIEKIAPEKPGHIIKRDAKKIPFKKEFKLKIPKDAPIPSEKEKYDITIMDKDGKIWPPIDPYLKIPPGAGGS